MPEPTPPPAPPRQPTSTSPSSSAAGGGTHFVPEGEVHLLDRLAVLYRYRRLCVTVFILSSAAMIIQGYTTIQMYQAMARLEINDERSTAVPGLANDLNTYYEDPEPYFSTQHKILKGRDLTRRVVRKLHLDAVPEFNGTAAPPPTPITMFHALEARLIALVRPTPAVAPEPPKADESSDESGLVSSFIGRVEVAPVRGSHLVDVSFTAQDPKFAATAANALVDEYVEPESAGQAPVDPGHARLARARACRPAEEGRGQRACARPVPRARERAVSGRKAEHRPRRA